MLDFRFIYLNDNAYGVSNVTKITIQTAEGLKDISGDEILMVNIPLQTMHPHMTLHNA